MSAVTIPVGSAESGLDDAGFFALECSDGDGPVKSAWEVLPLPQTAKTVQEPLSGPRLTQAELHGGRTSRGHDPKARHDWSAHRSSFAVVSRRRELN
jgi:hypothetical protein